MSAAVGPSSAGPDQGEARTVDAVERFAMKHSAHVRRRALAPIDTGMLLLAVVLIAPTTHAMGLGLAVFALFSFLLLLLSEECIPHERGRLVVFAEIASVPVVLAASMAMTSLVLRAGGTDVDAGAVVVPWLLASAYVLAGRAAFAWAAARVSVASVTELVDLVLKRIVDVVVAGALLVLTLPVSLLLAAAIRLEDRGPVLYRCRRVGQRGRDFDMLKFRKMRDDATGPPLTTADDDRFTRVGRFLARWKLDELPQLWNVIRGEMSLVGPRPEDPEFVALHPVPYANTLRSRPGITGLCQLAFAKESQIIGDEDPVQVYAERFLPQKLGIDLLYVRQRTVMLDLKILCWTALVLLRWDVAVHRQTGRLTIRRHREESSAQAA